jgi:hypothetical protein
MTHQELKHSRWSNEKAKKYMASLGVIKGVNYIPSYCVSYIEMWHHFKEDVIYRELRYAKRFGFNSLRIFVAACQWESRREIIQEKLNTFLDWCKELGFTVMLTLQPNTYMLPNNDLHPEEDPFIINFKPGCHDGSWTYKGAQIFDCNGKWIESKENICKFVCDIISSYGQDKRVTFWDLYNECHTSNIPLQELVFSCARSQNPIQPLTACWNALDISDITTFHCYATPGVEVLDPDLPGIHEMSFSGEINRAKSTGRPILCTECLARTFKSEMTGFLPVYRKERIGFYIWGLCAGSAQYHFPWDWPIGSPEPKRWFHCVMYPDGSFYDQTEYEMVQAFDFE